MENKTCKDCFWYDEDIDGSYCGLNLKDIEDLEKAKECTRFDFKENK